MTGVAGDIDTEVPSEMAYAIRAAYIDIVMALQLGAALATLRAQCANYSASHPLLAADVKWWFLYGDISVRFGPNPFTTVLGKKVGTSAWAEEDSPRRGTITLTPLAGYERYWIWLARSNHALGRTGPFQLSTNQIDSWGALLGHEVSHLAGLEQAEENIANSIGGLSTDEGPKFSGETTVDIQ